MNWAELQAGLASALAATTPVEAAAAALGLVYVVLAIRQSALCWLAALVSTALYLVVFFRARLYMQAGLQLYYVAIALYGWWSWRRGAAGGRLAVSRASWRVQAAGLVGIVLATLASAGWLARESGSPQPWLDSLTTWASVFTTWLVARKALENWAWWFVVDTLIVVLCWQQKLYATMLLYVLYLGLVIVGWRTWQRDMQVQAAARAASA